MKAKLILVFLLSLPGLVSAQIAVSGGPFEFYPAQRDVQLNIPLTLTNVKFSELRFLTRPASVKNGQDVRTALADAIRIDTTSSGGPHLVLSIHTAALTKPTNYEVSVAYWKGGQQGFVGFSLTRVTATLTANKLEVENDAGDIIRKPFYLTETGGKADVIGLNLGSPALPGDKSGKALVFETGGTSVGAAKFANVNYTIDFQQLPIGETNVEYLVNSDQLSAPLKIQIALVNKHGKGWLIGAILIGLAFGNGLRHVLKKSLATELARSTALKLIYDIKTNTLAIADATFKEKINKIIADLLTAINNVSFVQEDSAAVVTAGIELAKTAYETAKTDIDTRRTGLNTAYLPLRDAFAGRQLSAGLERWFNEAKDSLKEIEDRLAYSDIDGAQKLLIQATDDFKNALSKYQIYVSGALVFLSDRKQYLPDAAIAGSDNDIQAAINGIRATLDAPPDPALSWHDQLQRLNKIQTDLVGLTTLITSRMQEFYQGKLTADPQGTFAKVFDAWKKGFENIADNAGRAENIATSWNAALLATLNAAIANPNSASRMGDKVAFINDGFPDVHELLSYINGIPLHKFTAEDVPKIKIKELQKAYKTSVTRYFFMNLLQIAILTVVIGFSAALTYGPKFTGTFADLGMLFFVGFSLDVSLDAVAQLKGKPL